MPEKRRKTENATNPAQHQRGEKLFLRRIGCQKKILTWRCHLRLKCLYSRTHMGNVGLDARKPSLPSLSICEREMVPLTASKNFQRFWGLSVFSVF